MRIEVQKLRKEYGDLVAVEDVSFVLPPGAILALTGPNGAGKTSLMKMMAALMAPTSGTVKVGEIDGVEDPKALHRVIGFLPDFFGLYDDLTVEEYLEYFARAYGLSAEARTERIRAAIADVGLEAKTSATLTHLSRGMRQRVGVARALINDPPVILLDEPASGLDPEARTELQELLLRLSASGKTLIVSSHILTELEEYCTHVAMMHQGRLRAFGTIEDVRATANPRRTFVAQTLSKASTAGAILSQKPGVSVLEVDGETRLRFAFSGPPERLPDLIRSLLVDGEIPLTSFAEDETRIHDAYMTMMKGTSQ